MPCIRVFVSMFVCTGPIWWVLDIAVNCFRRGNLQESMDLPTAPSVSNQKKTKDFRVVHPGDSARMPATADMSSRSHMEGLGGLARPI